MTETAFEILAPAKWHLPAVFNSPHSGRLMPAPFLHASVLTENQLRQSEDCFVDDLFVGCTNHGAPLLRALVSRAVIDLNREPYELDARMFNESLPGFMNTGSPRVAAGFGTVPRLVGDGLEIYRGKRPLSEALTRIDTLYRPYHRALNGLLAEAQNNAGFVLLVDCHSMPSLISTHKRAADIVLGDRFGTSCSPALVDAIESYFTAQGLHVARNKPYAGAFITATYGAPQQGRHALQIEVNRALYMDEARLEPAAGYPHLKQVLSGFAGQLKTMFEGCFSAFSQRWAAE
jgi:N-formylglutamate amidohydrolase